MQNHYGQTPAAGQTKSWGCIFHHIGYGNPIWKRAYHAIPL
ncbi:hypothetical protein ApDm4_0427 [Acetobacter pomorum]|nr:hypothetical protein ApDm4_0427 [Acetobacter pomorum]